MKNALEHLDDLRAALAHAPHLVLFDFDGTLVPIAPTPEAVALPHATRALLEAIAAHAELAIVSGRALDDLRAKVGIAGITYAGNHGLEWIRRDRRGAAAIDPDMQAALVRARGELAALAPDFPGFRIEDKGASLALHYRAVDPSAVGALASAVAAIVDPYVQHSELIYAAGDMVYDVRPAISWNKGAFARMAIEAIARESGMPSVFCAGDDTTDEDAFTALADAFTVKIGPGESSARYFVPAQSDVTALLEVLAAL